MPPCWPVLGRMHACGEWLKPLGCKGAPMKIAAGLLGFAFLGAIGAAVYLLVQLGQTETVLAVTTASLHETADGLRDTTGKLQSQMAVNVELEAANGRLDAKRLDLEAVNSGLLSDKENLTAAKASLEVSLADSKTESAGLRQGLVEAGEEYRGLEALAGTVESLRLQEGSLRDEVKDLKRIRTPLVLSWANGDPTPTSGIKCTGSMEPMLTCLDKVTVLSDFRPDDVVVGATIVYGYDCLEDEALVSTRIIHRVMDIKFEGGQYHYWPKGDGNREADGCWVPASEVHGYAIEVHRNVNTENAELRDEVNTAYAAYLEALDALMVHVETYLNRIEAACGHRVAVDCTKRKAADLGNVGHWLLAERHRESRPYVVAWRKYEVLEKKWDCWHDKAVRSSFPGHIPATPLCSDPFDVNSWWWW